jgi:hypothetical protein
MQSQFQSKSQGTWPDGTIAISYSLDFLVVAGGGAGGAVRGGGGGAGGYRASGYGPSPLRHSSLPFSNVDSGSVYTVTVGGGGSGSPAPSIGASGSNSVFNVCGSEGTTKNNISRRWWWST